MYGQNERTHGGRSVMAGNRPRWRHVYDDIRDRIERGTLHPGDRVPAELDLAESYGYARSTVRRALQNLEQDALVTAGAGSLGRTVRRKYSIFFNAADFERGVHTDDPARAVDQWKADVQSQGWTPRQVVQVDWMPAPPQVAEYLQVEPGTKLVRRRRIRMVSRPPHDPEMPVMLADTWTTEDIAQRTLLGDDGNPYEPLLAERDVVVHGGIFRAIGINQREFDDLIIPRTPTPEETNVLELEPGSPVGQHARIGLDQDNRPVRVLLSVWSGERQVLRYRLPVPTAED